ncbi:hypothetical protein ACIP79_33270 [Streptomyces sp. NPDC088747]|uniref:hypothetical protein n=1 Tax=Streptomyces sp. NPDC088747 TaxID=3365886 RepID=UPI003826777E
MRATVAALSGALVLSAFAVPAAEASDSPVSSKVALSSVGATAAVADLDVTFSSIKVNNGKSIVVGATGEVSVPVTYRLTHDAGLDAGENSLASAPFIYRGGTSPLTAPYGFSSDDVANCTEVSTTVLNCSAVIYISPSKEFLPSSQAGTWKTGGLAAAADGSTKIQGDVGTVKVLRTAKLTVNAAPEPVKKGKTITVTGKLTRANWDTNTYGGYGSQSVVLQFRKNGTTNYTNVKGIKSTSTGALKTTVTASTDGYYRFTYAGSATAASAAVAGDYVDVQ